MAEFLTCELQVTKALTSVSGVEGSLCEMGFWHIIGPLQILSLQ